MSYEKKVTYTFEVSGETWEVLECHADYMRISETRKNGQEDCHTSFDMNLLDGLWVIDEWGKKSITAYWWADTAEKIEAYINKNGVPCG